MRAAAIASPPRSTASAAARTSGLPASASSTASSSVRSSRVASSIAAAPAAASTPTASAAPRAAALPRCDRARSPIPRVPSTRRAMRTSARGTPVRAGAGVGGGADARSPLQRARHCDAARRTQRRARAHGQQATRGVQPLDSCRGFDSGAIVRRAAGEPYRAPPPSRSTRIGRCGPGVARGRRRAGQRSHAAHGEGAASCGSAEAASAPSSARRTALTSWRLLKGLNSTGAGASRSLTAGESSAVVNSTGTDPRSG